MTLDDLVRAQSQTNDALNNLIEALRVSGSGGGGNNAGSVDRSFKFIASSGTGLAEKLMKYGQQADAGAKKFRSGLSTFHQSLMDGTKGFNDTLKMSGARFAEQLLSGETTAQDFNAGIRENIVSLRQASVEGRITASQYRDYRSQLLMLQNETYATVEVQSKLQPVLRGFNKSLDVLSNTALTFTKTLMGSGQGTTLATSAFNTGIGIASTGVQKLGGAVTGLGTAMLALPHPVAKVGGILTTIAGGALELFGSGMKQIAEKAMPMLAEQTNKLWAAYQTATSVGVIFANGIQDLTKSAVDAGIGVPEFARVIKENSTNLAASGVGMAQGAKNIAQVGKTLRESKVSEQLIGMGISMERQLSIASQVQADFRRAGRSFNADQIATTTASYAKNLQIISNLTGDEASAREKKVAAENRNLRFQQFMDDEEKKNPGRRKQIEAMMQSMSEPQRAMARELIMNGQLVSEETNTLAAAMPIAAAQARDFAAGIKEGTLTQETMNNRQAAEYSQLADETKRVSDTFGLAADLGVSEQAKNIMTAATTVYEESMGFTKEALENARKAQQALTEQSNQINKDFAHLVQRSGEIAAMMDDFTLPAIGKYTSAVNAAADTIIDTIAKFAGIKTPADLERERLEAQAQQLTTSTQAQQQIDQLLAQDTRAWWEKLFNIGESEALAAAKRRRNELTIVEELDAQIQALTNPRSQGYNGLQEGQDNIQIGEFAKGGISVAKDTGGLAVLHGTEAVLPLENTEAMAKIRNSLFGDGNNIVDKNNRDIIAAMSVMTEVERGAFKEQVTGIKSEQTAMMESLTRPALQSQERMLEVMNGKFEEMISLLRDVSNHTEMTSARVA